ncbi:MAG: SAM-dependent methyltransferase [Defluviitaleaceae bacterium]|nr:SAM-dependent methyltransferase [Defluviitaleaceae bacterium]
MSNANLGQVFTRRIVADYMVSLFTLPSKSVVLDPCFGEGVFLRSLFEKTDYSQVGFELDPQLFDLVSRQCNNSTLHNADFLQSEDLTRYDGVIMNPPYIRHEKIDDLLTYGLNKHLLQSQLIFSDLPKSANLYMYFVVKAIEILKPTGELIVIFPDSWINSRSGSAFKAVLSQKCSIEKKIHITGKAFEKDALVDVVILKLRKNMDFKDCETLYINIDENGVSARPVVQHHITTNNKVQFDKYAVIRRGLTTGFNKMFVNPNFECLNEVSLRDIVSTPKAVKGYCTSNAICDKLFLIDSYEALSQKAKDYLHSWEIKIKQTQKPKTLAMKIKRGANWYALNIPDCNGILFGYIVRSDMRFILNKSNKVARDNFYVITPKIDIYVLFALLNNYYIYTQLELAGRSYGGGMLKLQKYDVETVMLPNLKFYSSDDVDALSLLGKNLAKSGNPDVINKISMLISKYEDLDFETIKLKHERLRSTRLAGAR